MGGLDVANGDTLLPVLRVQDLQEGVEGLDEAEGTCDRSFPRSK